MTTTTWPAGVIARYLTVAGSSLADAELAVGIIDQSSTGWLTALCRGCGWTDRRATNGLYTDTPEENAERIASVLPVVRNLAQHHAADCRAMPRPADH